MFFSVFVLLISFFTDFFSKQKCIIAFLKTCLPHFSFSYKQVHKYWVYVERCLTKPGKQVSSHPLVGESVNSRIN